MFFGDIHSSSVGFVASGLALLLFWAFCWELNYREEKRKEEKAHEKN